MTQPLPLGGTWGADDRTRRGERSPHPPSSPEWLLSSLRPWRDEIWANLTGYYGNSAPQPLLPQQREAQPIISCRWSRRPTPTLHVWAGVRRWGRRRSVGRCETWCCYQPSAAAGLRGNTSGVAQPEPAQQCRVRSLPEGESLARTWPPRGVRDLASARLRALLSRFFWVAGLDATSSNRVPRNGSLGQSAGWSRFCWTLRRGCPAHSSRISSGPSRDQVQGELFGNPFPQVHGGLYVAAPGSIPESQDLNSRERSAVCLYKHSRPRVSIAGEDLGAKALILCIPNPCV